MASVNNDLLGMDPAVSAPTVGTPAADVPGVATPVEPDTVVASGGTKKNQYMVPIIAGIIFTIVFGFIVATFAGMMTMNRDIQTIMNERGGMVAGGTLDPRVGSGSSFSVFTNESATGCAAQLSTASSAAAVMTTGPATVQAATVEPATLNVSGSLVSTTTTTVTYTKVVTTVLPTIAPDSCDAAVSTLDDDEFSSTTTVTIGVTTSVTVIATQDKDTTIDPDTTGPSTEASGSRFEEITTAAGSPLTAVPMSTIYTTTTRKVTSVISGIAKNVTLTETVAVGLTSVVSGAIGTITAPASTANITWMSSGMLPHGPVSTSIVPSISGGSASKPKGGNLGSGASGHTCVLMLAAAAIGFLCI